MSTWSIDFESDFITGISDIILNRQFCLMDKIIPCWENIRITWKYNRPMDFFNIDPNLKRTPPEETRIIFLDVKPYEDGRRIHVYVELTPFQKPPFIEFNMTDADGNEAGSASIIEPPRWKHELTMHIKHTKQTSGEYHLTTRLIYPEIEEQDKRVITFCLSNPNNVE